MTKTPEQMATDWYIRLLTEEPAVAIKEAYKAGYQAAKDETNLPTSAKWISVKERLPLIYQRVLILIKDKVFISSIEEEYVDEYRDGVLTVITFWDGDWDWPDVTHWMPLPSVEGLKHED